jgi:hypothetical protein
VAGAIWQQHLQYSRAGLLQANSPENPSGAWLHAPTEGLTLICTGLEQVWSQLDVFCLLLLE